jgi:hypothetical protein
LSKSKIEVLKDRELEVLKKLDLKLSDIYGDDVKESQIITNYQEERLESVDWSVSSMDQNSLSFSMSMMS